MFMRNLFFLFITILLPLSIVTVVHGQNLKDMGNIELGRMTYNLVVMKRPTNNLISITNVTKDLIRTNPKLIQRYPSDHVRVRLINAEMLNKIILEYLRKHKINKNVTDKSKLFGTLFLDSGGKVLRLSIVYSEDIDLKLEDVANIEKCLREHFLADLISVPDLHSHLNEIELPFLIDLKAI